MGPAIFFQNQGLHLFAVRSDPRQSSKAGLGFVFCHPYAEEKQRVDRVMVSFSKQIAQRSYPFLRFDCRGYGDSEGRFEEATIDSQLSDLNRAVDLMCDQPGVDRVLLLGIRFGASIAALYAEQDPRVEILILWSPIVKGSIYLDLLFRNKMFSTFGQGMRRITKEEMVRELESKGHIDIDGYYLTKSFYEEVKSLDLAAQVGNFNGRVFLGTLQGEGGNRKHFEELMLAYDRDGKKCTRSEVGDRIYWDMKTHYEWYFPEGLFRETLAWVDGLEEDQG